MRYFVNGKIQPERDKDFFSLKVLYTKRLDGNTILFIVYDEHYYYAYFYDIASKTNVSISSLTDLKSSFSTKIFSYGAASSQGKKLVFSREMNTNKRKSFTVFTGPDQKQITVNMKSNELLILDFFDKEVVLIDVVEDPPVSDGASLYHLEKSFSNILREVKSYGIQQRRF